MAQLQRSLPLLPAEQQARLQVRVDGLTGGGGAPKSRPPSDAQTSFGLSARDALTLIDEPAALEYFHAVLAHGAEPRTAANWIVNDLFALANARRVSLERLGVAPAQLADLLHAVASRAASVAVARRVLPLLAGSSTPRPMAELIAECGGAAPMSDDELRLVCARVVDEALVDAEAQRAVRRAQGGDERALRFFVGRVIRDSKGRADAVQAEELLKSMLNLRK